MTIEIDGVNNTLKTDKIEPQSGTALQISDSGDTVTLPSGSTLTVAGTLNSTGSISGFGSILDWQTGDIKTATFTAVAGKGYFCNTTGGAFNFTLPSSPSAGDLVGFKDYAETFNTNNLTIDVNGSNLNGGSDTNPAVDTNGAAVLLLYVDGTRGWIPVQDDSSSLSGKSQYVTATGGTITTSGDFKIHTFTSSGNFVVSAAGAAAGSNSVDYLIVGGGGGGGAGGGGAGAGGLRQNYPNPATGGTPVSVATYPVVVGAGGAANSSPSQPGVAGVTSSALSVSSAGGGAGPKMNQAGDPGGSGSGGGGHSAVG